MPQRLDYTILDRVIARRGSSVIEGEVVSMELEEEHTFARSVMGIVHVTIRVGEGSLFEISSNWDIKRVESDGR